MENSNSNACQQVFRYLNEHQIPYQLVEHAPAFHVSDLVDIKEPENGKGVKNLFLRDDKKENFFWQLFRRKKGLILRTFAAASVVSRLALPMRICYGNI